MHISKTVKRHLGWCPDAPAMRTAQTAIALPPATMHPLQPGGKAGESGRIDRGFYLFFGSIRILFRNRQLFVFSFLTGLVLLFNLITTIALLVFSGTDPLTGGSLARGSPATLIAKGSPVWVALTTANQMITVFSVLFLMVGLITCVLFLLSGRAATIREGLFTARGHVRFIAGWAVAFVLIGTARSALVDLYPENFSLLVISGSIMVFLCIVMLCAIPVLVSEERSLFSAIRRSLWLFRKTWGEILLCCFLFGLFFSAVASVSLLPMVAVGVPSGDRVSLGITVALYEVVLLLTLMIGTTVIGILLMGLYTCAKTGRMPEAFFGS
jgi:hypothetical protein